ncbi:MAG TPA: flagellar hook-length control protein FliK [Dissulfurispiraceae bacterium]|nr:flagellar hook-length control protein FliK [Dissulfurispiraceae bacterium]
MSGGARGQTLSAGGITEKETPFQRYLSASENNGTPCEQCQTVISGTAEGSVFPLQLFKEALDREEDQAEDLAALLISVLRPSAPANQIHTAPDTSGSAVVAGDPVPAFSPLQGGAAAAAQEGMTVQGQDLHTDIGGDTVQKELNDAHFRMPPAGGQGEDVKPASEEEFGVLQNPATETVVTAGDDRAHIAVSDLQDAGKSANEHIQVFVSHPQTALSGKGETQVSGESGAVRQTVTVTELTGIHRPILKALAAGERQLIIEIRPPDLGTLQIRLTSDRGIISADITVDSQAVRDMLSVALPQIRTSMEESGVSLREFSVDLRRDPDPQDDRREQQTGQDRKEKEQRGGGDHFLNLFA